MNKFRRFLQIPCYVIIAVMPILGIAYYILFFRETLFNVIPLPKYFQYQNTFLVVVAVGMFFFLLSLMIVFLLNQDARLIWKILIVLGAVFANPCFCLTSYTATSLPETIFSSAEVDHNRYYVTAHTSIGDTWIFYNIYKCNQDDLSCEISDSETGGSSADPVKLIVDETTDEIYYFRGRSSAFLIFTFDPQSHYDHFEDCAARDGDNFCLYSYDAGSGKSFVITRCNNENRDEISCEVLPIRYSTKSFDTADLKTGDAAQVVEGFVDGELIFSYDTVPHCYVEGCTILK